MSKICWIDLETSGLESNKAGIIQLAALADCDGDTIDEFSVNMKPDDYQQIDESALKVHNTSRETLETYERQSEGYGKFINFLDHHIDKYNKSDKFIFAAYNADFDDRFLRKFFLNHNNVYYGSYFWWPKLDMQTLVALAIAKGLRLPNYKLSTICEHYKIPIVAHDALSDIRATMALFNILKGELNASRRKN